MPSPKVATYDLKPEMSAPEVTEKLVAAINEDRADFYIVNFANCDMVGHTGVFEAAVKAVEAVDDALSKVIPAILAKGGFALITADHGNATICLTSLPMALSIPSRRTPRIACRLSSLMRRPSLPASRMAVFPTSPPRCLPWPVLSLQGDDGPRVACEE